MPKITQIGAKPDEFLVALQVVVRHKQSIIEYGAHVAAIRKAHYDAHLTEGFTAEQALELCKSITL